MINMAVFTPDPDDACSFYRTMWPLGLLRKSMPDLNLIFMKDVRESSLQTIDLVFMQRGFNKDHLTAAEIIKSADVPLWVDYDDDLMNIPESNPARQFYKNAELNVRGICSLADKVSVTTEHLKSLLQATDVIPNALPNNLSYVKNRKQGERRKIVAWRGSKTHDQDLMYVGKQIIELSQKHKDWQWHFIGHNPWFVTSSMTNGSVFHIPHQGISDYWKFLGQLNPSVMMVPLAPNDFNLSKSNIALLEGTWAGAAVLSPHWDEWKPYGSTFYECQDSFFAAMDHLMTCPAGEIEAKAKYSLHLIEENLLLTEVNKKREKIIRSLCGPASEMY